MGTNLSKAQRDMLVKIGEKSDKGYAAVRGEGRALGKLNADKYIVQGTGGGILWTLTPIGVEALKTVKGENKAAARKSAK